MVFFAMHLASSLLTCSKTVSCESIGIACNDAATAAKLAELYANVVGIDIY